MLQLYLVSIFCSYILFRMSLLNCEQQITEGQSLVSGTAYSDCK